MEGTATTDCIKPGLGAAREHKVLAVDNEWETLSTIQAALTGGGFAVEPVCSGTAALKALDEPGAGYDLVLFDFDMPDIGALAVLDHAKRKGWDMPIVITAAGPNVAAAIETMHRGAFDLLVKPFSSTERLFQTSQRAVASRDPQSLARLLEEPISGIRAQPPLSADAIRTEPFVPLAEAKRDFERRYLSRLLEQTGGNRAAASRIAGMDPSNLRRLLRRHGMLNRGG